LNEELLAHVPLLQILKNNKIFLFVSPQITLKILFYCILKYY